MAQWLVQLLHMQKVSVFSPISGKSLITTSIRVYIRLLPAGLVCAVLQMELTLRAGQRGVLTRSRLLVEEYTPQMSLNHLRGVLSTFLRRRYRLTLCETPYCAAAGDSSSDDGRPAPGHGRQHLRHLMTCRPRAACLVTVTARLVVAGRQVAVKYCENGVTTAQTRKSGTSTINGGFDRSDWKRCTP